MHRKNEDGTFTLVDRREMLRVKLKSLAAEARIIRLEEKRAWAYPQYRQELHRHRVDAVRRAARDTHVAYGLIKGKTLDQIEGGSASAPNWDAVEKMIKKYGPAGMKLITIAPVHVEQPEALAA